MTPGLAGQSRVQASPNFPSLLPTTRVSDIGETEKNRRGGSENHQQYGLTQHFYPPCGACSVEAG
jgi:hypothetical protein